METLCNEILESLQRLPSPDPDPRSAVDDQVLGWTSRLDVKDMCEDQWRWASKYPKGYER